MTNVRRIYEAETGNGGNLPPSAVKEEEGVRSRVRRGGIILLVDLIIIIALMAVFESPYSVVPYAAEEFESGRAVFSVASRHDEEMGRAFQLRWTPSKEEEVLAFDAPFAVRFVLLDGGDEIWERSWTLSEFEKRGDDLFFETVWNGRHQVTNQVLPEGRYTAAAEIGFEERPRIQTEFNWNPRRSK